MTLNEILNYIKVLVERKYISTLSVVSNDSKLIYGLEKIALNSGISIAYIDKTQNVKKIEDIVHANARIFNNNEKYTLKFLYCKHRKSFDNSLYFLTSGSTGNPKLVMRDRRVVLQEARALKTALPFIKRIVSNVLPTHYYGFIYNIALPLVCSIEVETVSPMYPITHVLNDLDGTTALVTTPWHEYLIGEYGTLKSHFTIISSGADPYYSTIDKLKKEGITVVNQFGSTELGALFIEITTQLKYFRIYLNGVHIHFSDTKTIVDTPYAAECYIKEGSSEHVSYELTDIFKKSESKLKYLGRSDTVININGLKINPEVIESKINAINCVSQSYVEKKENNLNITVYLSHNTSFKEIYNSIKEVLNNQLNQERITFAFKLIISKDPLTKTGKIVRRKQNEQ